MMFQLAKLKELWRVEASNDNFEIKGKIYQVSGTISCTFLLRPNHTTVGSSTSKKKSMFENRYESIEEEILTLS